MAKVPCLLAIPFLQYLDCGVNLLRRFPFLHRYPCRVAGLDLFVTANTAATTDTDDSIMIINPDAYTWYESPSYQLRAESTADGSITVGVYSFGAVATKIAAGAFGVNKS